MSAMTRMRIRIQKENWGAVLDADVPGGVYTRRLVEGNRRCHFFFLDRITPDVDAVFSSFSVDSRERGGANVTELPNVEAYLKEVVLFFGLSFSRYGGEGCVMISERPYRRLPLRDLMTDAEKRTRTLIEHFTTTWLEGVADLRDLSRPI